MAGNEAKYQSAVRQGESFLSAHKWREAIAAFRLALAEFNERPAVYAGLGDACVGLKELGRALDCYKLAARFSRGDIDALLQVADIQERLGFLSEAGRTYLAAGELLLRRQELDAAVGQWERAVRLEPNLLAAHQRLAMVFQRQDDARGAVREYLAIARILDRRGEKKKALKICRAALRLDPTNGDIQTAMKLIEQGEEAYPELAVEKPIMEPPARPAADDGEEGIFGAVRQMASVFEAERSTWALTTEQHRDQQDPVRQGQELAEDVLTAEIFRADEEDDYSQEGMIKLERDALIGQALDFAQRGEFGQAIRCFRQAIDGGLDLPAAHFYLGFLLVRSGRPKESYPWLKKAAADRRYNRAIRALLTPDR